MNYRLLLICFIILNFSGLCYSIAAENTEKTPNTISYMYQTLPIDGQTAAAVSVPDNAQLKVVPSAVTSFLFQQVDMQVEGEIVGRGWIPYALSNQALNESPAPLTQSSKSGLRVKCERDGIRVFSEPDVRSRIVNYFPKGTLIDVVGRTRFFYRLRLLTGEDRFILKREVKRVKPGEMISEKIPFRTLFSRELTTIRELARARADRYYPLGADHTSSVVRKNIKYEMIYLDQYFIDFFLYRKHIPLHTLAL